jgi:SAM-dependent methyltransferase
VSGPREKWNLRWRERAGDELVADAWLLKVAEQLPGGRALDLACGRGRNALELARRGYAVTAVDQSEEALEQLAGAAHAAGLAIECLRCDLEARPPMLAADFDLVLCLFYLHRPLLPWLLAQVRPGGLALLRTFSCAGDFPPGSADPRFVLEPGELLRIFTGWEVLRHEEGVEPSRKGGSLAGILARKPQTGSSGRRS